jgi:hypothetical protein
LNLRGKSDDIREAKLPAGADRVFEVKDSWGRKSFTLSATWKTSVPALHLSCRKVWIECVVYLYRNFTLVSSRTRLTAAVLKTIRPCNLDLIRTLQLNHSTYGEPRHLADRWVKEKHDSQWAESCKQVIQHMPNIEHLIINIIVAESPFVMDLREPWVQQLLSFRQLKLLVSVEVHIFTRWRRFTYVKPKDGHLWRNTPPHIVRALMANHQGNVEIHEAFGKAIAMKILDFCDDYAMEKVVSLVNGKWKGIARQPYWQHLVQREGSRW